MNRRELLKRSLGVVPVAALGAVIPADPAEAVKRPRQQGMECLCTDIRPGGQEKNGKVPNGSLVVVTMVRRDNGNRVVAFLDKKTKIYRHGARIRFRDLRDMLYATPEGIRELYVDVPTRVFFSATQLAKRIEFDV